MLSVQEPGHFLYRKTQRRWSNHEWRECLQKLVELLFFPDTDPDWISVKRLFPSRGEGHGNDAIWKCREIKWIIESCAPSRLCSTYQSTPLCSIFTATPTCDVGKVKVKTILLITSLVLWNLTIMQVERSGQCHFFVSIATKTVHYTPGFDLTILLVTFSSSFFWAANLKILTRIIILKKRKNVTTLKKMTGETHMNTRFVHFWVCK